MGGPPLRDIDLVRLYWPVELRPAFDALFGINEALADVVATSTQPALGAIRLAWWREALARLDVNPPPPEPRLQAVAVQLLPRGITGAKLAELEDGWATLFEEEPNPERVADSGARLFAAAAQMLSGSGEMVEAAGRLFACENVRRRGLAAMSCPTQELRQLAGYRFPRPLRPLTGLGRLAARDAKQAPNLEPEATPGRAAALLSHRLFGKVV
jgi:phytoene synthase